MAKIKKRSVEDAKKSSNKEMGVSRWISWSEALDTIYNVGIAVFFLAAFLLAPSAIFLLHFIVFVFIFVAAAIFLPIKLANQNKSGSIKKSHLIVPGLFFDWCV